jgi:hypothetical protein
MRIVIDQIAGGDETIPYLDGIFLSRYGETDWQNFLRRKHFYSLEESGPSSPERQSRRLGGLSWTEIRLHCAASLRAVDGRRDLPIFCDSLISGSEWFTVAVEFII